MRCRPGAKKRGAVGEPLSESHSVGRTVSGARSSWLAPRFFAGGREALCTAKSQRIGAAFSFEGPFSFGITCFAYELPLKPVVLAEQNEVSAKGNLQVGRSQKAPPAAGLPPATFEQGPRNTL